MKQNGNTQNRKVFQELNWKFYTSSNTVIYASWFFSKLFTVLLANVLWYSLSVSVIYFLVLFYYI